MSHPEITADIAIEDLVRIEPRAAALLRRWGIVCIQCGEPVWGTLREAATSKGIEDLDEILAALNSTEPTS